MHKLLRPVSNGEYAPRPRSAVQREAARRVAALAEELERRRGIDRRAFLRSSMGAAATLFALSACSKDEGRATGSGSGTTGTFAVPPESTTDPEATSTTLAPFDGEVVVDVQTHFLDPNHGFGQAFPQSGCGDDACFTIDHWADLVLGGSDTSLAVLSALPIVSDPRPMSIDKMEEAQRLAESLCGDGRVLLQGEAFPQVGQLPDTLDLMSGLNDGHDIVAWKTYTHIAGGYSFLDDVGTAFLGHVEQLASSAGGPSIVCVHKGFGADPADVGPAAAAHPDLTFVAYHSGFESANTEGPFREGGGGVDRFVRSLRDAGIGPGGTVYAELGSTWWSVLGNPDEAAHTLGKLLNAVGAERMLWGTDSIWYGSPQDQIQAFRAFQFSAEFQERFGYPALTPELKRMVLGLNGARLFNVDPAKVPCTFSRADLENLRQERRLTSMVHGPTTRREFAAFLRSPLGPLI